MRLTINHNMDIDETQVIINCPVMDQRIRNLADYIRQYSTALTGEIDGAIYCVPLESILYFDCVDRRVFFYDAYRTFQCRHTLAYLEEKLENTLFVRISKNCLVNLALIRYTVPCPNHRLEIVMTNGEHLIVSRTYRHVITQKIDDFKLDALLQEENAVKEHRNNAVRTDLPERSVLNMGRIIAFSYAPKRVAVLSYGAAELMCALGVEDKVIAIAPAEDEITHTLPDYRRTLERIPLLTSNGDGVPTLKELEAMGTEMAVCAYYFQKMIKADTEANAAFPLFVTESTVPGKTTVETLYRDIFNLGLIFRVENRAVELVEQMRRRLTVLTRRLARRESVRVFVYDGKASIPLTALRDTFESELIALAAGKNVFAHCAGTYQTVEWEAVAHADPQVIIIHDYLDSMTAAEKIACLKAREELRDVSAIRDDRFVIVSLTEIFPGVQNINAVEKFIRAFHPDAL